MHNQKGFECKRYLLTAAAAVAFATPAAAVDNSMYIGGDIGGLIVQKSEFDTVDYFDRPRCLRRPRSRSSRPVTRWASMPICAPATISACSGSKASSATRAPASRASITAALFLGDVGDIVDDHPARRRFRRQRPRPRLVRHGQRLLDFGGNGELGGFVGGGVGFAGVKHTGLIGDSDSAMAWQGIAGVYMPVGTNFDIGLKYRYFRTGKLESTSTDLDYVVPGAIDFDVVGASSSRTACC